MEGTAGGVFFVCVTINLIIQREREEKVISCIISNPPFPLNCFEVITNYVQWLHPYPPSFDITL